MPRMTFTPGAEGLVRDGLVVEGQIVATGPAAAPRVASGWGLIDTGADGSAIRAGVEADINLPFLGEHQTGVPGSDAVPTRFYGFSLFVFGRWWRNLHGPALPHLVGGNIDFLIGRDILQYCRLGIDFPGGAWSIEVVEPREGE